MLPGSIALQHEPQLQFNKSLTLEDSVNALNSGTIFGKLVERVSAQYTCNTGYSECAYDPSRCCPTGNSCCGNGYCASSGDVCCDVGTCPSGYKCCSSGNCAPTDGDCCDDGYYCAAGKQCSTVQGKRVCCPASGCSGETTSANIASTIQATQTASSALSTGSQSTCSSTS